MHDSPVAFECHSFDSCEKKEDLITTVQAEAKKGEKSTPSSMFYFPLCVCMCSCLYFYFKSRDIFHRVSLLSIHFICKILQSASIVLRILFCFNENLFSKNCDVKLT